MTRHPFSGPLKSHSSSRKLTWRPQAFLNITNDTSDNFSADSAYSTALVLDLRNSTNYARGTYGLAVPPVGDGHGTSKTVLAVLDYQEFDFAIQDGACAMSTLSLLVTHSHLLEFPTTTTSSGEQKVFARRCGSRAGRNSLTNAAKPPPTPPLAKVLHGTTAASQSWFSCADTVNGTQGYFLRWGVFTSGGAAPDGCGVTDVVQSFNLPARVPSETDGGREAPGEE